MDSISIHPSKHPPSFIKELYELFAMTQLDWSSLINLSQILEEMKSRQQDKSCSALKGQLPGRSRLVFVNRNKKNMCLF